MGANWTAMSGTPESPVNASRCSVGMRGPIKGIDPFGDARLNSGETVCEDLRLTGSGVDSR